MSIGAPERHSTFALLMVAALALAGCGETITIPEFRSPIVFDSEPAKPATTTASRQTTSSASRQASSSASRQASSGSRATIAVAYVGDEATNLRAGPGTRYRVVGSAPPGARIEVLSSEGGWLEIRNGRSTAWLAERLTRQETGSGPARAAVADRPADMPASTGEAATVPIEEDASVLPDF